MIDSKIRDIMMTPSTAGNYSESALFDKLAKFARKIGLKGVYSALILFYALMSNEVPMKDKAVVIGALGYLILPVDLIPDFLPAVGYTDDAGALVYAVKTVWDNITPSTMRQARNRLESWFGHVSDSELELF